MFWTTFYSITDCNELSLNDVLLIERAYQSYIGVNHFYHGYIANLLLFKIGWTLVDQELK